MGHHDPAQWRGRADAALKRFLDVIIAAMLLTLLGPVIMALALLTKTDGGPAFHAHRRIGRDSVPFNCWKLRTMVLGADQCLSEFLRYHPESQIEWARERRLAFDPRITPIGRLLRKTDLDGLPQLWNVIVGDMSLVGPRPVTEAELRDRYARHASALLSVRPGLTGPCNAGGRDGCRPEERVSLDMHYIGSRRLATDIAILFLSSRAVLARVIAARAR